jgi:hypothetical protein
MMQVSRLSRRLSFANAGIVVLMAVLHMAGHLRQREPRTPEESTLHELMGSVSFSFLGGRFTMNDARATLNIFYFSFAALAAVIVVLAMPALQRDRAVFARVHVAFALALVGAGVGSMLRGFTMPGPAFLLGAALCLAAALLPPATDADPVA